MLSIRVELARSTGESIGRRRVTRTIGPSNMLASLVMAGLAVPGLLPAQQRPLEETDLPAVAAQDIVAFFNDPGTFRFNGRSGVPEGRLIVGDVGVLGGPFLVAGEIQGDLVVVNGDVRFTESGRVDGDVLVVGGDVLDALTGSVTGTTVVYSERLRYSERQGRISYREPRPLGDGGGFFLGRSRFTLRSAGSYNRVEGLPVLFGPVIDSRGPNTTRIEAMGL